MTPATVKRCFSQRVLRPAPRFVVLVPAVVLAALLLAGCGGTDTTTTTTAADTTTTSEAPGTSTTDTSEVVETTTTVAAFPPTITHEQDGTRFAYAGTWKAQTASGASGKSFTLADKSGCKVTIRFYGEGISWLAKTSPAYGEAEVTVDGGPGQTVDLYSATTTWKKKVWKSGALELGDHTVVISWTGKKNEKATGTNINVDALTVVGVLTGTFQQTDSKLAYAGTWKTSSSSASSGGSYKYADAAGAKVTVKFTGVRLVWVGRTGPGLGQAKVSVDGGPDATVDLFKTTTKSQQDIWDSGVLEFKTHTVVIEWTGGKDANATGTAIVVDAFRVTGSLK